MEVATIRLLISRRAFLASAAAVAASPARSVCAPAPVWRAGVAAADITPRPGVWMAGYAARTAPAMGVAMPLRAKALALEHDGRRFALVTVDLLGVTAAMRQRIGVRLSRMLALGAEAWMLAASHTHSGPVVDDQLSVAYDLDANQRHAIAAYTASLESTIAGLVGDALGRLEPAMLAYGEGLATFGANRRTQFLPPGACRSGGAGLACGSTRRRPAGDRVRLCVPQHHTPGRDDRVPRRLRRCRAARSRTALPRCAGDVSGRVRRRRQPDHRAALWRWSSSTAPRWLARLSGAGPGDGRSRAAARPASSWWTCHLLRRPIARHGSLANRPRTSTCGGTRR